MQFGEISLCDYSESVKLPGVLFEFGVLEGEVEVKHFPAHDFLEVEVRNDHEVYSIEVCRLPLDVPWVGGAPEVLLLLVVEDQSIVLVRQAFYVFLEHELDHVELGTGQAEEVFYFYFDRIGKGTQHLTAPQQVCRTLETFPEGKLANILAQVDESVEDEVPDLFV